MNDLQQYVNEVKAKKQGAIPPLPEFVQIKMFRYHGDKVRDPFLPVVDVEVVNIREKNGPRPDDNRIKEPLESYALDSLRMMGTLIQTDITWILVKDPEGLLHRLTMGNYLGLNNGKIVAINDSSVEIKELVPDGSGWEERKAGLALAED